MLIIEGVTIMTKNEIIPPIQNGLIPDYADGNQIAINLNTGNGNQIGTVQGNYITNLIIQNENDKKTLQKLFDSGKRNRCTVAELAIMPQHKFNVFVVENEEFRDGVFTLPKAKCLKVHMTNANKELYKKASPETLLGLRKYPCIFATKNISYTRTSDQHVALLGRITDVICQEHVIKFTFEVCEEIKQNILNANARYLGLFEKEAKNELDDSGWALKDGNLLDKLQMIGINLLG